MQHHGHAYLYKDRIINNSFQLQREIGRVEPTCQVDNLGVCMHTHTNTHKHTHTRVNGVEPTPQTDVVE